MNTLTNSRNSRNSQPCAADASSSAFSDSNLKSAYSPGAKPSQISDTERAEITGVLDRSIDQCRLAIVAMLGKLDRDTRSCIREVATTGSTRQVTSALMDLITSNGGKLAAAPIKSTPEDAQVGVETLVWALVVSAMDVEGHLSVTTMRENLVAWLEHGQCGLSTPVGPGPWASERNFHLNVLGMTITRSMGPMAALEARQALVEPALPAIILMHHLVHDCTLSPASAKLH